MIHESSPWKTALVRDAELIERWAAKPYSARRSFLIERKVFLAAYSLRKLGDDVKISNATLTQSIGVRVSPPLKEGFSNLRHWVERYFDLENSVRRQLTWRQVLNMVIHSAVFAELVDDDECVTGFMVTSDKEIKRGLVHVQLSDFVQLMRTASVDYPTLVHQAWDAHAGKWVSWAGHGTLNLDKVAGG
jgi:hypothetical protein